VFVVFAFAGITNAFAQKPKIENLPKFDRRKVHFGFSIGINSSNFTLRREPDITRFDSLLVLETQAQPGFNLGIIADYHITPVLNIRFIQALSFAQRNIEYTFPARSAVNGQTINRVIIPIESTFLEFPVLIKYRSARLNNFAAYIVGGFNYRLDLASNENAVTTAADQEVKLYRHDFAYEIGVGFDFFMEYFKFSPEIKLSFGIPNIMVRDGFIWTDPIQRLSSRIVVISFHFEG
jgi:hypothetical protein